VTEEQASAFAATALVNIEREYPRHVAHLLTRPAENLDPRKLHPAFYGSYDWHSAVHMHWLLARILRLFPEKKEIGVLLGRHLSPAAMAVELAYFRSAAGRNFERPYGWAWLLELQAELLRLGRKPWSGAVQPLADEIARRMAVFVGGSPHPIRAGSHGNTAFACLLALDYAKVIGDVALSSAIRKSALQWYAADRDAPLAYEPSLDDFLSPSLVEGALMRELMAADEFRQWSRRFFSTDPAQLELPTVADRTDPKQSHLDGLCLSRAWCFRRLGYAEAARRHLDAGLRHATGGDYAGEHWLASFAALALGEIP
jgi:hypothetical protein